MKRMITLAILSLALVQGETMMAQQSKLLKVENYCFSKWNPETMQNEQTDTPVPFGNDVNYYYDTDGRLSMQFEIYPVTGLTGTLSIFAYNELGQVSSTTRYTGSNNSQTTEYFYDEQGRLVKEQQNSNGYYSVHHAGPRERNGK